LPQGLYLLTDRFINGLLGLIAASIAVKSVVWSSVLVFFVHRVHIEYSSTHDNNGNL